MERELEELPLGEGLFQVGGAMDFGRVTGYLNVSGTGGKRDGDGYAVTVGIRVPL